MARAARSLWAVALAFCAAVALALGGAPAAQARTSAVQTVFTPTSAAGYVNPGAMYARSITLHHAGDANGTILTTFEVYTNGTPYFPVYRSTDGGTSWSYLSQVTDTVNGYGMRWNPQIYELPAALGSLPAGTLLEAGLSVPADRSSTEILLYDSTDQGASWHFLSSVAKGGAAWTADPNTPVWEPFLLMNNGRLDVYYSDQRENSVNSQKLVHQTSTDGTSWGSVVDDVVYSAQSARPGMATVAAIGGGKWIMTYEYCNAPSGGCPVYYKIASDPESFGSATGQQIVLNDGSKPCCQPYVVWTPSGGANGTIVVSDGGQTALAVNTAGGATGSWKSEGSNAPGGYSRSLMLMPDGNTVMTLTGGYHDSTYLNQVQFALDNIAPGISAGATYTLTNSYSGLNLGATATADGSPAVQLTAASTSTQQQWVLTRQADGYFTLTDVAAGKLLAVTGGSTADGATTELRTASSGSAAQEWSVVQQPDGSFTLANRRSGLLLDDYQWSKSSGSTVDQWEDTGGANQRWTLTQTALPALTTGQYSIQNNFGEYLEIPGGSTASGTQADQWWYADQSWHLWRFAAVSGGYQIVNVNSGLVLTDTYPASTDAITQTAAVSGNSNQVWTLVPHGNQYLVKNAGTGRYVTIAQGSSGDLAKSVSWTESDTSDQLWTVRRLN
ncbi:MULTISPECIES: RICIN domain-containing protein [Streptacidiphilus]|uniref:RICIN domain-containing protein n=1 Tax=Streptacidiphilus cavernicola TaxID=3342716 RepID=A0ABV6UT34_9ACTN|nr:RICIN domain-containing protein [Streptacidiphilus jeojiense]